MSKILVEGLKLQAKPNIVDCEVCVEIKQSKARCSGKLAKEEEDYVIHSGIIGSIKLFSTGISRYILAFIVERSRFAKLFRYQRSI